VTEQNYDFPGMKLSPFLTTGSWMEISTDMVTTADVIITIGGGAGTLDVYEKARLQGKPVVPISTTGGVSTDIWQKINTNFSTAYENTDRLDFTKLNSIIESSKLAELAVSLAISLVEREHKKRRIGSQEGEKYIFVIMSFDKHLIDTYNAIKQAVTKIAPEFLCERIDNIQDDFRITDKILECIQRSTLVIADLTGERPNVYYELGFARGIGKKVIHLARNGTFLHFDVKDFNTIFYENIRDLEEKLAIRLCTMLS